jgi:4-hydroxybenzoate polyprenyltransferase
LSRIYLYLDLIRWDRPAGWLLLLWPSLSALWVAAGSFPGWHLVGVFVAGTILMRSAGCCLNDVADREFDRHVKRTAQRPVTTGAVSVKEALLLGAVLAALAFGLVLTVNRIAIVWSMVALAIAVLYPYAKRVMAMPQAVLGVAFSFGIPMAFASVLGTGLALSWNHLIGAVPVVAWLLLLGNLFWVLAYDTEYAMVDRDDDLRIGIKTSAITLGVWDVPVVMTCYLVHQALWCAVLWEACRIHLPPPMAQGWTILVLAIGMIQAGWHFRLIRARTREGCFKAFRLNHWLGFTWFVGWVGLDLLASASANWP